MTEIVARKVTFDFPDHLDDVFPGDNPAMECWLAAFSLTMPYLEPYLIRSMRSVVDELPEGELASDVRAFVAQEAQHHRQHRKVNEIMKGQLAPDVVARLEVIEQELEADYRRYTAEASTRFNLLYAEGFEAMTLAVVTRTFANVEADAAAGAPGRFGAWQQLWAWHGAEEIEHRTVAFQVYEHVVGRYPYRVAGSIRAQVHYSRYLNRLMRVLLEANGHSTHGLARGRQVFPPWWSKGGWQRHLRSFGPRYDPATVEVSPLVELVLSGYT